MDRTWPRRPLVLASLLVALLLMGMVPAARAQEPAPSSATVLDIPPEQSVATIDGEAVTMRDVQDVVRAAAKSSETQKLSATSVAQALETAIDQRLVRRYVLTATEGATPEQIDEALERLKANIAQQGSTFEALLAEKGIDEQTLRDQLNWQISWGRYISQSLTDAALEACFVRHRRDLDGTQLRASHILLRIDQPQNLPGVMEEAKRIKQEIADGKITFADAAKKYSEGPSRRVGGDLGMIGRNGPMVPAFNDMAFSLEKGKVGDPVVTPFGVHLIQVTDEKPGDKQWTDVQEKLKQIVAQEMVTEIAKQQREIVKLEYRDDFPHFLPGAKDLAPMAGATVETPAPTTE